MKILIFIFSLVSCVSNSDFIIPVLLKLSNRTSDDVQASVSTLLQYSKDMSNDHSEDATDHVDVIYFESSSSDAGRQGFSDVEKAADESKLASIMTRFQRMYNSILDLRFSDLENIRFHVIMDQIVPDFSVIKNVCPFECSGCVKSYAEIFCRICCGETMKDSEPMDVSSFLNNHFDHVLDWLTSSMAYTGLKTIYNNIIGRGSRTADQDHVFNPQEINHFIRNFYWNLENSLDLKMPDNFEAGVNICTENKWLWIKN